MPTLDELVMYLIQRVLFPADGRFKQLSFFSTMPNNVAPHQHEISFKSQLNGLGGIGLISDWSDRKIHPCGFACSLEDPWDPDHCDSQAVSL